MSLKFQGTMRYIGLGISHAREIVPNLCRYRLMLFSFFEVSPMEVFFFSRSTS